MSHKQGVVDGDNCVVVVVVAGRQQDPDDIVRLDLTRGKRHSDVSSEMTEYDGERNLDS